VDLQYSIVEFVPVVAQQVNILLKQTTQVGSLLLLSSLLSHELGASCAVVFNVLVLVEERNSNRLEIKSSSFLNCSDHQAILQIKHANIAHPSRYNSVFR